MEINTGFIDIFILAAAGFVAGCMNVTAGGGSAFTLPILIFLGLDSATANGTNRIAIVVQSISAIGSFKSEKYSDFKESMKLAFITLPGGILGALISLEIPDEMFNKILAILIIGVIATILIPSPKKNKGGELPPNLWTFLAMFGVGLYGGFIQIGVGFMMMAIMQRMLRMDLIRVNMHKVFIALIFTTPAMLVFIISGKVDWVLGLVLAAGNALGAWIAAKLSVRKGEKFIKFFIILSLLIMSIKLFDIF